MKYHALFVKNEKATKFEIVVCCNLKVELRGLIVLKCFHVFSANAREMLISFRSQGDIFLTLCMQSNFA